MAAKCMRCGKKHCYWCGGKFGNGELRPSKDHYPAQANVPDRRAWKGNLLDTHLKCNNQRGNDDSWVGFHGQTNGGL